MSNGRSPTRHYCDHFDCGKSFRRAEHLNRHKLNHTNATIKCPQCDHLFYRRDLLKRHLILKHKKGSKTAHVAEETSPSFDFEVSPPDPHDNGASPVRPAYSLQGHEEPSPPHGTTLTVAAPVNVTSVTDIVLPISGDVFAFPSPGLDLAQDWTWLNQYPLPAIPVNSGAEGQTGGHNVLPDIQSLNENWINPSGTQDLYLSQEVFEYLISLIPVVETTRTFTREDVTSILNAAFVFILEALPIFHQPSFSLDLIHNELCASIFCLGLLITREPASYQIGCALLGQTRSKLLHYVNNNTIYLTDLEILQAMLLNEFCGMYLADRTAMELSDIFHGTLVTLSRRLDLFELASSNPSASSVTTSQNERQLSIEQETAKRLAYFVFALDIEHALLFGHERSMLSVYAMKLELPSDEGDWQTLSSSLQTSQPLANRQARYHLLCHNLLSATSAPTTISTTLNPLSSFLVLLGLASVALDVLRRQQDPFFDTKHALAQLSSALPAVHNRLMAGPDGPMKIHGRAVYHITAIALCTPLDDLERAANDGFSRTGRTPKQHTRAAIIRLLTKHKVGAEPARHAIYLLKLYLVPDDLTYQSVNTPISATDSSPLGGYSRYESSALYFGVLTLWAYIIGRVSNDDDDGFQLDEHPSLPDEDFRAPQHLGSSLPTQEHITNLLQGLEEAIDGDNSLACRRQWRILVQHVATRLAIRWNNNAQEYSQVLKSLSDNLSI